jgi:UDP-N-acetylglucosamine 1-carboxyvinyltransferase
VRLGAQIRIAGQNTAIVMVAEQLSGAPVTATDIRAGAAPVIAGSMAQATAEVFGIQHLGRGYEHLEEKLRHLGAAMGLVENGRT